MRAYLFWVIAVAASLPVAILGFVQARHWADVELETTDRVALALERLLGNQIALEIAGHARSVEVLAAQLSTPATLLPDRLRVLMRNHMASHPEQSGAMVVDPDGKALGNVFPSGEWTRTNLNYADRPYFQRVLATRTTVISPQVSLGKLTGVPNIHVASPARDEAGNLLAVAVAPLDLGLSSAKARAVANGLPDGRVVVVDSAGHLIGDSADAAPRLRDVSSQPLFAMVRGEHELRYGVDEVGRLMRATAVPIEFGDLGWRVVAMRPMASIEGHRTRVRNETLAVMALALLAALVISAGVAAWLSGPVRALAEIAGSVTRGDYSRLPDDARGGPTEVADLTRVVGSMIRSLRGQAEILEGLVADRTVDLKKANLDLEEALDELRRKEARIEEDIAQARLFQESILPVLPTSPLLDIFAAYLPIEQVGGDIYDACALGPARFRFFVADAIGHGVQASMRTIVLKSEYDRIKTAHAEPAAVLQALNTRLIGLFPRNEVLCTACCFDLSPGTPGSESGVEGMTVHYSNAAHVPLLLFRGGRFESIHADGPLLGGSAAAWGPDTLLERTLTFQVRPGETLVATTDGLFEQTNGKRQMFETAILPELDLSSCTSARDMVTAILQTLRGFRGEAPLDDDLLLLAIRVV
jgi:serine phosphatase RsbU (regulator of sigma subunit)